MSHLTDDAWRDDYTRKMDSLVEKFGGKFIARTEDYIRIEGTQPDPEAIVLVEWPSKEAFETFHNSEEYMPFKEARLKSSNDEYFLLPAGDTVKRDK